MSDEIQVNERQSSIKGELEIGVLGSARLREGDERWSQAHKLGELLANDGFVIVTGGYGGLMAAISRGAYERGGRVVGLPMRHWSGIKPNRWNGDLRWSTDYGTRLNHLLRCAALIALPGGIGTLSEMALAWAASQTEGRALPLVLFGDCWPPLMQVMREHLVVDASDFDLLRFATSPEEALQELHAGLQDQTSRGSGPHG